MRISSLTMKNNYTSALNTNQKRLYDANLRISMNNRRYKNISENVALGMRAMKVRRDMSKVLNFQDNVRECQSIQKASEDTIREGLIPHGQVIQEKYGLALNGSSGPGEYEAIDAEIGRLQEEMLKNLNGQFSGRYLYGGSQTTEAPFAVDANGKLTYKGVTVADIPNPPTDPDHIKLLDDPVYIDIGLGVTLGTDNKPLPSTVFNRSFVGLDITGTGEDNMYDLITKIRDTLKSGTLDPELLTKMEKANNKLTVTVAKMGADDNFLSFTEKRLELDHDNLIERTQGLEFVEPEEAILEYSMREYTYNACLQMGAKLLQPSLFAYLN